MTPEEINHVRKIVREEFEAAYSSGIASQVKQAVPNEIKTLSWDIFNKLILLITIPIGVVAVGGYFSIKAIATHHVLQVVNENKVEVQAMFQNRKIKLEENLDLHDERLRKTFDKISLFNSKTSTQVDNLENNISEKQLQLDRKIATTKRTINDQIAQAQKDLAEFKNLDGAQYVEMSRKLKVLSEDTEALATIQSNLDKNKASLSALKASLSNNFAQDEFNFDSLTQKINRTQVEVAGLKTETSQIDHRREKLKVRIDNLSWQDIPTDNDTIYNSSCEYRWNLEGEWIYAGKVSETDLEASISDKQYSQIQSLNKHRAISYHEGHLLRRIQKRCFPV